MRDERSVGIARLRVLVVDDNVDSAESLALWFELAGHEVQTARDGPSALRAATSFVPDLVLLDIGLPGMTGYEVAERLRALPGLDRAFLAAQTGWGREADRQRSAAAGFDRHLTKPLEAEALEDLVASLGGRREDAVNPGRRA